MVALLAMVVPGCMSHLHPHNMPPAQMMMRPGPGVGGPGPGVLSRGDINPMGGGMGGMAYGPGGGGTCGLGGGAFYGMGAGTPPTSQLAFVNPEGMTVGWDIVAEGQFDSEPLVVPGRQNFPQAAMYRVKLKNIPGREGVELYPTIEVAPANARTDAYLAHTPIPIEFTEEDFDQVQSGNFVTKVIYLPDPEFQELALAGVETLVSTRLDPGVDPIVEADRRGSILAIVRLGNKDLELPGSELIGDGQIIPASHTVPAGYSGPLPGGPVGRPIGMPTAGFAPPALPPQYVAGVTGPQWGMPMSGTPIGLPGPPHVPLGVPAGLRKHVVKNNTVRHMPEPTRKVRIDVKQVPGFSYPKPPNHVSVRENIKAPKKGFFVPWKNRRELVR
ncbi:MAG: hypothetical protein ACC645_20125 [Pirellulales bacterium]